MPSVSAVSETVACPSAPYCWWSFSSAISLPPAVSNWSCLFTLWQPCIPAAVLYYWTFHSTVRLKDFIFVCLLCIICVGKYYRPITVQYYTGDFDGWVPKPTLLTCQMCSSDWNLFVCRVFLHLSFLLKLALNLLVVDLWVYEIYVWLYSKQYQHLVCTFRNFVQLFWNRD